MPASVIGLVLLFILLCTGVVKLGQVEGVGTALTNNISFLFVPAGISVINSLPILSQHPILILLLIIISTLLLLICVGFVSQLFVTKHYSHLKSKMNKLNLGRVTNGRSFRITTPYFGILVSLIPFVIAQYFYKNERFLLTSTTFRSNGCIVFLKVTGISYENYKIGGDIINFFLEPATISFAIPLYKNVMYLKILATNFWGIAIGTLIALILIYLVAIVFQLGDQIGASMLPQAATTAIALPVSQGIGGVKELTSLAVILNAVVISALGTKIVKWFKISNPIARGLALGTSGHTLGVAAAKELGETEESMGSIAVVIVGVIIVAIVPPLASILF